MWRVVLFAAILCAEAQAQHPALDALTRQQHFEARRESSSNPDLAKNGDARPIEPGGTLTLADVEGPGVVVHFWHTLNSADPFYGRNLVLRVFYDGAEQPSVEAPLGDFFGLGYGAFADYSSAVAQVSSHGRSRTSYWRMPFRERLRMTISNESEVYRCDSFYYYLDWQKHEALPEDTVYFHAQYRQQHPAQPGNHVLLDATGRGHYAGTVYSAMQMETGWFGEGDDFFYIDGATEPQLRGTGTEDYFNDAWGFRAFSAPYHGVPVYEGVFPGDIVSAYRWHLPDPVPFKASLRVEMEHRGSIFNEAAALTNMQLGTFEERADWVSSVAFWYQQPPAFLTGFPEAADRLPPHRLLNPGELTYRAEPPMLVLPAEGALMYAPNTPRAALELDFEVPEKGRYRLRGRFFKSLLSGVYQPYLDGRSIGQPLDLVILNADPVWHDLDNHDLEAGTHTLRFESIDIDTPARRTLGKTVHVLGLQQLLLLRLDAMPGYKQVTERLLQK